MLETAFPRSAREEKEKAIEEIAVSARLWAQSGSSAYFPAETTVKSLPAGQYNIEYSGSRGYFFRQRQIHLDDLIVLPDSVTEEIIEEIELFWNREHVYRELGFLWKRGVLLWGPPGGGKTTTIQLIAKKIIDRGGITVYVKEPSGAAQGLEMLRQIEPRRPIVVMIEDFDAIQDSYGEAELLAMLDGDLQIDNVVFIATTNYPEKLDKRIVNRPSRFDLVRKIDMPSADARRVYLLAINKRLRDHPTELNKWVDATDGFSVAHLKELIISIEALDQDFDMVIARLRKMIEQSITSEDDDLSPCGTSLLAATRC